MPSEYNIGDRVSISYTSLQEYVSYDVVASHQDFLYGVVTGIEVYEDEYEDEHGIYHETTNYEYMVDLDLGYWFRYSWNNHGDNRTQLYVIAEYIQPAEKKKRSKSGFSKFIQKIEGRIDA